MKNLRSNSLVYLLERTLRQTKFSLQQLLDKHANGISVDHWIVLQQIGADNGQNLAKIAASTAKDPASITRITRHLAEMKLVARTRQKNDQRNFYVTVTPAGKKMLRDCEKAISKFRTIAGKGLTQEELNHQKKILDKLFENCGGKL